MTDRDSFKINTDAFSDMQAAFFECTNTYGYCMDLDAIRITPFSGGEDIDRYIGEHVTSEMEMGIIASFRSNPYEDVIRMDTGYPGVLFGGIAIRDGEGRVHGVMVVIGVSAGGDLPDGISLTTEKGYASALTLATILLSQYFKEKNEGDSLRDRLREEEEESSNLSGLLRKNELITGILKRMESDDDFPKVSEAILSDVGEYLEVSNAYLLRLSPDESYVDMISEWNAPEAGALLPDFLRVEKRTIPFFTGRPYTVSSDAVLPDDFKDFFAKYDIRAGVFLPLFVSDRLGMYICFTKSGESRQWAQDELVILNDVKRIMQTILTKRVTKNSLASSYAVLDAILDNTGCGVCVKNDATGELLYTNELFSEMLSDKQDLEEFLEYIRGSAKSGKNEYHLMHADKRCDISFVPIKWVDGRAVTLCTLYDVTALYDYQKRLLDQSVTDALTGLGNRARFENEVKEYIRDAVRTAEQGHFAYIDLDDFKSINDSLGHSVGDELLVSVAAALFHIARGRAEVYRLGGDEFAMLIPHQTLDAEGIIESVLRRFMREFSTESGNYFCSATIAVTAFPADGTRADTLMQHADLALWAGKAAGKSRIEYYNGGGDVRSMRRLSMEKELRAAVENDCEQFEVLFAPIVEKGGDVLSCTGASATLLWQSPTLGPVQADEFIPLAEYLGLVVSLGRHILKAACERCRYWNDFGHPDFKVVINLSMVQLLRSDITDLIRSEIEISGVEPAHVMVEFREWGASEYTVRVRRALKRLSELGISAATYEDGDHTGVGEPLSCREFEDRFVRNLG